LKVTRRWGGGLDEVGFWVFGLVWFGLVEEGCMVYYDLKTMDEMHHRMGNMEARIRLENY